MGIAPSIDITTEQRKTILALLERHLPDTEAWMYGSRIKWTSSPQSDLDMVVLSTPEQARGVSSLREAFEDSNLPFRVDLFVWNDVPDSFRSQIAQEHVVLTEPQACVGGWTDVSLGECIILNDVTYSSNDKWPFVNYLDTGNITDNRIEALQFLDLNNVDLPGRARRKAKSGDIVFSTVRPNQRHFGLLRDLPENFLASTAFAVFSAREGIADTGFVYWFLTQDRIVDQLHTIAEHSTSAYPSIRPADIQGLNIDLPPLPEQRAIAHILGTLDDRIELNRRMNGTLEAMARATFRDWFVEFGPTRAKAEGREPYLAPELWNLFPDTLDDEGKPAGWTLSEIGKEVCAVGGGTPSTKEPTYWDGGDHHWATPKDLSKLVSPVLLDTDRKVTGAGVKKISSGVLPIGTVLLSSRAPIGYLAISEVATAVNQGFIAMVCDQRLPNTFVLFWCQENLDYIKSISGGSTFAEISKRAFRSIPVVMPSGNILAAYDRLIRPLYVRIVANTKENRTLRETRDFLLPKLMSGEIRLAYGNAAAKAVG